MQDAESRLIATTDAELLVDVDSERTHEREQKIGVLPRADASHSEPFRPLAQGTDDGRQLDRFGSGAEYDRDAREVTAER